MLRIAKRISRGLSITGPILTKELRVSSRRRLNYLVRSIYLAAMILVVGFVWLAEVDSLQHYGSAWSITRMAIAGRTIHLAIMWFQFCAGQLLAVILLSTAINEEVYGRTLGVLMSTPINSLQIVMGKLTSKLWQLLVLLATSIPLLALVRVFGGVSWEFVATGVSLTLAAMIFAAALSLYFSIGNRRSYVAMFKALFTMGLLQYGLLFMIGWIMHEGYRVRSDAIVEMLFPFCPSGMLLYETERLMRPGWSFGTGSWLFSSWSCCLITLAASAGVGGLCVRRVRRVALAQAVGVDPSPGRRKRRKPAALAGDAPGGTIRRLYGAPVAWKDMRTRRAGRGMIGLYACIVVALLVSYVAAAASDDLRSGEIHATYVVILTTLGAVATAVLAAGSITSEKEARTWPTLLGTTQSAREILLGKAIGAICRSLPVWGLLAGHLVIFQVAGYIGAVTILHVAMLAAWLIIFFTGAGLYAGVHLRRTTTAVLATLGGAAVIWFVLPAILAAGVMMASDPTDGAEVLEGLAVLHPAVQAIVTTEGVTGRRVDRLRERSEPYYWPAGPRGIGTTTRIMLASVVLYSLAGLGLAGLAGRRMRRHVF